MAIPQYRSLVGGFFSHDPFDKTMPVSIRMNNPGAINGASWERTFPGYVDTIETTPGNKSTIFETPENGVAAWVELMRRYRKMNVVTIGDIINRYGGGQDYSAYLKQIVEWTGLSPTVELQIDGKDDRTLLLFARAMFHYEAGRQSPLNDEQIKYGFKLARGETVNAPVKKFNFFVWLFELLAALFKKPTAPVLPTVPAWYHAATKDIGFHEVGENLGIEEFIRDGKSGKLGDPWCAIAINAWLERSGIRGSRSPAARSYEHDANFIKLPGPSLGAIVTMWRGSTSSGSGHVFLYDGENSKGVRGIGANESDGVRRSIHARARIVGYYWPASVSMPRIAAIPVPEGGEVSQSEV